LYTTTAKYKKSLQSTIFPTYKSKVKERKQDIRRMRVPLAERTVRQIMEKGDRKQTESRR
jgi:hypothetical protein